MSLEHKYTCSGVTLNGKNCNRNVSKHMYCYQHLNQSIKHGVPMFQQINIERIKSDFESNSINNCELKCTKRNKYGEYICKEQPILENKYILCKKHMLECKKFYTTLNRIVASNVLNVPYNEVSLDRKLKLYIHLTSFIIKHREENLVYEDSMISGFISSIRETLSGLSLSLYNSNKRSNPTKLRKQNKSYKYYKEKLENHITRLESCFSEVIIKKNRDTLVSNSIKIQKISECYVKIENTYLPVICKGINEKILSFIV
jgi:hypothetical protein